MSTSENTPDTIRSPALSSSTKGAKMKKRTRAIRSCTAEKRRNLSRCRSGPRFACTVSFIQSTKFLSCYVRGDHLYLTNRGTCHHQCYWLFYQTSPLECLG